MVTHSTRLATALFSSYSMDGFILVQVQRRSIYMLHSHQLVTNQLKLGTAISQYNPQKI